MSKTAYDTALISCASSEGLNLPVDQGSAYSMPIQSNLNDVISYRVKDVSIPQTYYNITTGNQTFSLFGSTTGNQNIVIPPGNYTSTQLSGYISVAWLALTGTNITLDFAQPSLKLVVTRTGGVDATIAITAAQLAFTSMTRVFGFTAALGLATSLTAQGGFNLGGPNKILVQSVALNTGRNMSGINITGTSGGGQIQKNNVIWAVYKQGNAGDYINNQIPSDWYSFQTPQKLGKIDLYLTDENNQPLDLNGYSWSITIELRQKKDV